MDVGITDGEFARFQRLMHRTTGVWLPANKKTMVWGRLAKRLQSRNLATLDDYYRLITEGRDEEELQRAIDLLTTHETYFFREPRHFSLLAERILPRLDPGRPLRVWSAACSSGEEAYSIAMVLMDRLGAAARWDLFASDISTEVLAKARAGIYAMERIEGIPPAYLRRFCLRGVDHRAGKIMIERSLRDRVRFAQVNLAEKLPDIGEFDVIFIRNVLIYFDAPTKSEVVCRLTGRLRPGGWLIAGHSETIHGLCDELRPEEATVYRKM